MTACIPVPRFTFAPVATSRMHASACGTSVGVFRLPTDPLFYADLVLQNIVSGSRYRVTIDSDGTELATGVAGSTEVTLSGLAVYSNPQLVSVVIRNASGSPTYKPFETKASMSAGTTSVYVSQIQDE